MSISAHSDRLALARTVLKQTAGYSWAAISLFNAPQVIETAAHNLESSGDFLVGNLVEKLSDNNIQPSHTPTQAYINFADNSQKFSHVVQLDTTEAYANTASRLTVVTFARNFEQGGYAKWDENITV